MFAAAAVTGAMASEQEEAEVDSDAIQTLPEVPDDGVLIKTLYAGVCHATHSLSDDLDLASFVGQFSFAGNALKA